MRRNKNDIVHTFRISCIIALFIIFNSNFSISNEVKNYDFNSLAPGDTLDGKDNWVMFGPGWTFPIVSANGPDGSLAIFATAGGGSQKYTSRINDGNYSITSFTGDENSAVFQIDAISVCWTTHVGIGYDDNSNNMIESSECGIRLAFLDCITERLSFIDAQGNSTEFIGWDAAAWVSIRVVMDFTANGGQGSASVYTKQYGTNSFAPIAALQNINMNLNPALSNHLNPANWNAMHFYYDSDGRYHDNFFTANSTATLTTTAVTSITGTSAVSGGNITDDLGDDITARGVVWSTSPEPTLVTNEDGHTTDGTGTGNFVSNLTGMSDKTVYYVRAYAQNNGGIAYGNEIMFTTIPTLGEWGLIAFGSLLAVIGGWFVYRKFM